jgi:hypothetical protein
MVGTVFVPTPRITNPRRPCRESSGRLKISVLHRVQRVAATLLAAVSIVLNTGSFAAADAASTIPPIVLQECVQTPAARYYDSMDISLLNTTSEPISLVIVSVGDTEIANRSKIDAGSTISWRVPAIPGPCKLRAVRFSDDTDWLASPDERIPPVVLQFCAPTAVVRPNPNAGSMDLSFVNLSVKPAKLLIVSIGDSDVANSGTFTPGSEIKWRLPAEPGPCKIKAVRFDDGSEWNAP